MNNGDERIELSLLHGANIAEIVCPICELVVDKKAFGQMHRWCCAKCGRNVVDRDTPKGECPACHTVDYDLDELDVRLTNKVALPQPCPACHFAPRLLKEVLGKETGVLGVMRLVNEKDEVLSFIPFSPTRRRYDPSGGDALNGTIIFQHNMIIRGRDREGRGPEFLSILFPGLHNVFVRVSKSSDGSVVLTKVRGTNDGNVITETV